MYTCNQNFGYPGAETQSLTRVTGLDGAKAYQMSPNSTAALFDAGEDIMYIKSTDGAGFPTIRVFRFSEVDPRPESESEYITKEDFEGFKKEMMSNVEQLIRGYEANGGNA